MPSVAWVVGLWAVSRLWLLAVGSLTLAWLPPYPGCYNAFYGHPAVDMWIKWDAGWYLTIASDGYSYTPGELGPTGWFPLFPWLVRLFSLVLDRELAAVVVTNLALLGALLVLRRLLALDHDATTVRRSLLLLVLFPGSVFFSSMHSEATFLLCASGSFLAARTGRWALAGLLGGGAALTRLVGLGMLPALLIEFVTGPKPSAPATEAHGREKPEALGWILLVPLAVLGFFLFLQWDVGEFWAYVKTQRLTTADLSPWRRLARGLAPWPHTWFGLPWGLLATWLAWRGWAAMRPSYRAFVLVGMALPFLHGSFVAFYRYAIVLFPLAPAAATLLQDERRFRLACAVLLVAQAVFMGYYARGHFLLC